MERPFQIPKTIKNPLTIEIQRDPNEVFRPNLFLRSFCAHYGHTLLTEKLSTFSRSLSKITTVRIVQHALTHYVAEFMLIDLIR